VLSIGAPEAAIRHVRFPKMSWAERLRAARFETLRWTGFEREGASTIVRVHPVAAEDGVYAVGAAAPGAIQRRLALAKAAGLRVAAIDHDAYALRRLYPQADAIVDVSGERSIVHAFAAETPVATVVDVAGDHITRAIARELSLDAATAEKRKRILGCAGAGSQAQDSVVASVAAAIERLRTRAHIGRIAVTGNGGRLPGFVRDLQAATGAASEMPVPDLLLESYPADVVRTAAPDWALAAGLLTWSAAA
jgi:Tfp pilus assembly PilM family ATPase